MSCAVEEAKRQLALGRAPIPFARGVKGPTRDGWQHQRFTADEVQQYFDDKNIGLLVGAPSGNLVDVDLDCAEAIELADAFLPLTEMRHGRPTRRDSHRWYLVDEAPKTKTAYVDVGADKKTRGKTLVELRSSDGTKAFQTMIPPSIHPDGEELEWEGSGEPAVVAAVDLQRAVRRLAAASLLARHFPAQATEKGGGARHDFCMALGGALLRNGWSPDDAHAFVGNVALAGGSDDADKRAASVYDTATKIAAGEKATGIPRLVEIVGKNVVDRAVRWLDLNANAEAPQPARNASSFTAEELAAIARNEGCTVEELATRWIIQRANSYYVLADGGYRGPLIAPELGLGLRLLDRAPLIREGKNAKGDPRPLTPSQIVANNGTLAREVFADLTIERSRFDAVAGVFYEAAAPLRELEPRFDEQIDAWLRLLGGDRVEKLLDWTATAWDLSRQTSALYLQGPKSAGKTLYAFGLTRMWTPAAPVALDDVLGTSFNSGITRSPLVFGDEQVKLPDSRALRAFIGADGLELKRKFLPNTSIRGCPRLVIAGNRDDLLHFDREVFAQDDVEAVAVRFVHIRASAAAAEYLRSIGGRAATDKWVDGDLIARHALWLALNRDVVPGKRFLVEGDADEMARKLATGGTVRGLIVEAVARAVARAARMPSDRWDPDGFRVGGGSIHVNTSWLHDRWNMLMGSAHHVPTTKAIGQTLEGIAAAPQERIGQGTRRPRCWPLKVDLVLQHAEELGLGATETALVDCVNVPA